MIQNEAELCPKQPQKHTGRAVRILLLTSIAMVLSAFLCYKAKAASINLDLNPDSTNGDTMGALQVLFLFTLLSIAPSLLIMMTSFTRVVIVLSLLRNAIGLTQTPPNQVIIGLALFLSLFIMAPTIEQIQENSITPYMNGNITQQEAIENLEAPLKTFMLKQIKAEDLNLFLSLEGNDTTFGEGQTLNPDTLQSLAMHIVVPAFITSELRQAFVMGFLLFLPFLVIDMIVASTLMSMGMVMLPPTTIALPFKLMLFVVVGGWELVIETLVASFH